MPRENESKDVTVLAACPACDGAALKRLPVPGHWIAPEFFSDLQGKIGLMKCRSCRLVFVNPRPSDERLAAFYSGDTYTYHESGGSSSAGAKADYLLAQIARSLPADAPRRLLDYGAGGGGFLSRARELGWMVRGFEPAGKGRESCQAAGLDVTDRLADLSTGEFGLVTLHHVFEHLSAPTEVLQGLRRLLAPGGRLFIEVPNCRSLRAQLSHPVLSRSFRFDERYRAYPIHLFYYSEHTLRAALEKAGWAVERTFTVGMGLDQLVVRKSPQTPAPVRSGGSQTARRSPRRRIRHSLRDAFLNLKLGEGLAVIARPTDAKAA